MQLNPCNVQFLKGGKVKLLSDLSFLIRGSIHTVYSGYIWDMASIPKLVRGIIGCPSEFIAESCLHDVLYESGIWPRETCDLYFYLILRSGGEYKDSVGKLKAKSLYAGVKIGGEPFYKQGSVSAAREFVSVEWL